MSVSTKHPLYDKWLSYWIKGQDCYSGEAVIKENGLKYLPCTSGMYLDGMENGQLGLENYSNYVLRSVFPEYVKSTIERNVGRIHLKPFAIQLPEAMEPMRNNATPQGETLLGLLVRLNVEQMITGRVGLLLSIPKNVNPSKPMPTIATYNAISIRNWSHTNNDGQQDLQMMVLDESRKELNVSTLEWEDVEEFRVLRLNKSSNTPVYEFGILSADQLPDTVNMTTPKLAGKVLNSIPFIVLNSKDLAFDPDRPPLDVLANLSLTEYRGEADYRQALHQQGQETLVIIGGVDKSDMSDSNAFPSADDQQGAVRTGVGTTIEVDTEGDAKYIGVSSSGLSEQRLSMENDRAIGQAVSGSVVKEGRQVESSNTISTRIGSQTTTLNQISVSSAKALERILKQQAEWMMLDPDEVVIVANQDFDPQQYNTTTLKELAKAKLDGLPLSQATIHAFCKERGFTEHEFADELKLMQDEQALEDERVKRMADEESERTIATTKASNVDKGGNDPIEQDKGNNE